MAKGGDRPGSLAFFLTRLRPGSECACCGGHLEAEAGRKRGVLRQGAVGEVGRYALVCPVCGCEVTEQSVSDDAACWGKLYSAA